MFTHMRLYGTYTQNLRNSNKMSTHLFTSQFTKENIMRIFGGSLYGGPQLYLSLLPRYNSYPEFCENSSLALFSFSIYSLVWLLCLFSYGYFYYSCL